MANSNSKSERGLLIRNNITRKAIKAPTTPYFSLHYN